jgi:hypothetical protein
MTFNLSKKKKEMNPRIPIHIYIIQQLQSKRINLIEQIGNFINFEAKNYLFTYKLLILSITFKNYIINR